jgi:hypothetical protein
VVLTTPLFLMVGASMGGLGGRQGLVVFYAAFV